MLVVGCNVISWLYLLRLLYLIKQCLSAESQYKFISLLLCKTTNS